jgi:hypothetical protein
MDVIHARLPNRSRARAVSLTELRLQLASVAGGSLVVIVSPSPEVGIGAVGAVLVVAAAMYASSRKLTLRFDIGRTGRNSSSSEQPPPTGELGRDLLDEAEFALARNRPRVAIVLAASAARATLLARNGNDPVDANATIDALLADASTDDNDRARRAINAAAQLEALEAEDPQPDHPQLDDPRTEDSSTG